MKIALRWWKPACVVAAMVVTQVGSMGNFASAQVLDQVPADALVVVKINKIEATSKKLGKLATDLNLVAFVPQMADPLAAMQEKAKITNGLEKAGDMAFAFIKPPEGGAGDRSMLLLFPVSDYKAFVANFAGATATGDITQVTMGGDNQPSFVAHWGNYAAVSPMKEIVSNKPAGLKLMGQSAKQAESRDIVAIANFAQIRTLAQPHLMEGRNQVLAQAEKSMLAEPKAAPFVNVAKVALNEIFDVLDGFLRDTNGATIGLDFGDAGVNITEMLEFNEGTYVTKLIKPEHNTDKPLLTGIPAGKYILYGGGIADPAVATKVIGDLSDPIAAELKKVESESAKSALAYIDAIKQAVSTTKGQSFAMLTPTAMPGQEPLIQYFSIINGDAKTISAANMKMIQSQQAIMEALGLPGAMKATVTSAAKTVEGVAFDQILSTVEPGQGQAAAQQAQAMMMMYGPNGMSILFGSVKDDTMLMASGVSDAVLSSTINTIKGGQSPLADSAGVKAVNDHLPKNRSAVMYFAVDELAGAALNYAQMFGMRIPVQVAPNLPPIAAAVSSQANSVQVDIHVPTDLVRSLVATGLQAYMQMQGGQGGPPDNPPHPHPAVVCKSALEYFQSSPTGLPN